MAIETGSCLGKASTCTWLPHRRLERRLLANVEYFNDLIVTHQDEEYMRK